MTRNRHHPAAGGGDRRRDARRPRTPSLTLLSLRGELTAYLADELLDAEIPVMVQKLVDLVRRAEQHTGLADLGAWHRGQVDTVLGGAPESIDRAEDETALAVLFGFLSASGRWAGDPDVLRDVLSAASRALAGQLRVVAAEHGDAGREAAAVGASDVVRSTTAFLDWFGTAPRTLTATGALRRDDTHAAIRSLDLSELPRPVTSMWDHPDLVTAWSTCLRAGLVMVRGSRASVTAAGSALRAGDPDTGRELLRWAIAAELSDPEHGHFSEGVPLTQVADMALAAMQGDGPPLPGYLDDLDSRALLLLADMDSADPDEESAVVSVLYFSTLLASGGFLELAGRLAVVPGLESLVLTTLADLVDGEPFAPGATQVGMARSRGDVAITEADPAGATVRLWVHVDDDHRPGSRIDLPADGTLVDLHRALLDVTGHSPRTSHEFLGVDPVGRRTRWAGGSMAGVEDETRTQLVDALSRVAVLGYLVGDAEDLLYRVELEAIGPSAAR